MLNSSTTFNRNAHLSVQLEHDCIRHHLCTTLLPLSFTFFRHSDDQLCMDFHWPHIGVALNGLDSHLHYMPLTFYCGTSLLTLSHGMPHDFSGCPSTYHLEMCSTCRLNFWPLGDRCWWTSFFTSFPTPRWTLLRPVHMASWKTDPGDQAISCRLRDDLSYWFSFPHCLIPLSLTLAS